MRKYTETRENTFVEMVNIPRRSKTRNIWDKKYVDMNTVKKYFHCVSLNFILVLIRIKFPVSWPNCLTRSWFISLKTHAKNQFFSGMQAISTLLKLWEHYHTLWRD